MQRRQVLFLDNVEFAYDGERGVFRCLSIAEEDMTLEEVRRRGMTMSLLQVVEVRGVPYLYEEKADTFYRLGNTKVRMTGDEFHLQDLQGRVSYPYGEGFRALIARERDYTAGLQRDDRDR